MVPYSKCVARVSWVASEVRGFTFAPRSICARSEMGTLTKETEMAPMSTKPEEQCWELGWEFCMHLYGLRLARRDLKVLHCACITSVPLKAYETWRRGDGRCFIQKAPYSDRWAIPCVEMAHEQACLLLLRSSTCVCLRGHAGTDKNAKT